MKKKPGPKWPVFSHAFTASHLPLRDESSLRKGEGCDIQFCGACNWFEGVDKRNSALDEIIGFAVRKKQEMQALFAVLSLGCCALATENHSTPTVSLEVEK